MDAKLEAVLLELGVETSEELIDLLSKKKKKKIIEPKNKSMQKKKPKKKNKKKKVAKEKTTIESQPYKLLKKKKKKTKKKIRGGREKGVKNFGQIESVDVSGNRQVKTVEDMGLKNSYVNDKKTDKLLTGKNKRMRRPPSRTVEAECRRCEYSFEGVSPKVVTKDPDDGLYYFICNACVGGR